MTEAMKRKHRKSQGFIQRTMGRDETLIMAAHLHWFYLFVGFLWFLGFVTVGAGLDYLIWDFLESNIPPHKRVVLGIQFESRGLILKWLMTAIGSGILIHYLIRYCTTRVALTNKRLLIRTNLIFVKVDEVDLEEIKSEHVANGLLGRFLNYGEITFDARFVGDISFPNIADPYRLLRTTHEARTRLSGDPDFLGKNKKNRHRSGHGTEPENEHEQDPSLKKISEDENYVVYRKTKPEKN